MLVGREGANPTEQDLRVLAASVDLKRPGPIIEQARLSAGSFRRNAEEAGLPGRARDRTAAVLLPRRTS
jgi:hypothetical protein